MLLHDLAFIASQEPALAAIGGRNSVLACAEQSRAAIIAALSARSPGSTLVVATPTGTAAQQLHDDIVQFLGADNALMFPAWETLPFERVSPSVETMGRRLEVLWRLRSENPPKVVLGSVRALLQKLGPGATTLQPIIIKPGEEIDSEQLLAKLVHDGYRREEIVEHRGEVARRGSIIDVFPSTADTPIRIDLWGDEVERLTSFNVNDQRSTDDLAQAIIFPARELQLDEGVTERARALVGSEPWGREHWDRLADGSNFEGMESWLPWLIEREQLITDVLPASSELIFVDPKRMRDRAKDLLAEEDDLAKALASTWARDAQRTFPRLHSRH
jgi:transcription-repair coupling factor (superfamily II helicase)